MMRKMLAVAIASIMAFSCITIGMISSESSEADIDGAEVGDAWGMDYEVTMDNLIYEYNKSLKEQEPSFNGMDKAELILSLKQLYKLSGIDIERLDFDVNGRLASITEVVQTNTNGTVLKVSGGTDTDGFVDLKVNIPPMKSPDGSEKYVPAHCVEIRDVHALMTVVGESYVFVTPAGEVSGYSSEIHASIYFYGKSNLFVDRDIETTNEPKDIDSKVTATVNLSGNYDTPVRFIPESVGDWTCEGTVQKSNEIAVMVSGNLDEFVKEIDDSSYFEKNKENDPYCYEFSSVEHKDGFITTLHDPVNESLDGITYFWPFEENIPESSLIDGSFALDNNGKNRINGYLKELNDSINMNNDVTEATMTFYDGNGDIIPELTETVGIGTFMTLPAYTGEVPEGTEFIGWSDDDDNFLITGVDDVWDVKGSYSFHANFGKTVDDVPTLPRADVSYVWNTDMEGIRDKDISPDVLRDSPTVVNVMEDGELRYSFKFVDCAGTDDDTVYSPVVNELPLPDRDYITDTVENYSNMYIGFESEGYLGCNYVSYNVSDRFADGTILCVYRDTGEGLEFVETTEVYGNIVNIHPGHCSNFLILSGMPELASVGTADDSDADSGMMLYAGMAIVAVIVILAAVFYVRNRRKNPTSAKFEDTEKRKD